VGVKGGGEAGSEGSRVLGGGGIGGYGGVVVIRGGDMFCSLMA